jgi:hypothetical protein
MDNIINLNDIVAPIQRSVVAEIEALSQQPLVAGLFEQLNEIKQEALPLLRNRELSPVDANRILQATRVCHQKLRQCEKDLTLLVEGKELQVNSFMLACLSPQLAALVAANRYADEPSDEPISLSNVSYTQMQRICAFLHGENLPLPITVAEVEELIQLAESSQQQGMYSILKACDDAFYEMVQLANQTPSVAKGWGLFIRAAAATFSGAPLATQLVNRKDLLLRLFELSGLEKTQHAIAEKTFNGILSVPHPVTIDTSNRKFLDKVLVEQKIDDSSQALDPALFARRWGNKTDEQKLIELSHCQDLADYLVENCWADLNDPGLWILEARFQHDLEQRFLDLFSFFLYIASSPNKDHRAFLPPILRALQRNYFAGSLSDEDAEWVIRIAGRDQALLQTLEEPKIFFALPDSELTPDAFSVSFDEAIGDVLSSVIQDEFNAVDSIADDGAVIEEAIEDALPTVTQDEFNAVPPLVDEVDDEIFTQQLNDFNLEQKILLLQRQLHKADSLDDNRLVESFQAMKEHVSRLEIRSEWEQSLKLWCDRFAINTASVDASNEPNEADSKALCICPIVTGSRFISMVRSNMIGRMQSSEFLEADTGQTPDKPVVLRAVTNDHLQTALQWMQTETINLEGLTIADVEQVLESLDYFSCKHFEQRFEQYLLDQADQPENMTVLLRIATERNLPNLLRACLQTLSRHYSGIIKINKLPDGRLKIIELDHAKVAEHPELQEILQALRHEWKEATLKYWCEQAPLPPRTWRKKLVDEIHSDRAIKISKSIGAALLGTAGAAAGYAASGISLSGLSMVKNAAVSAASTVFSYVPYGSDAYGLLTGTIGPVVDSIFSMMPSAQTILSPIPGVWSNVPYSSTVNDLVLGSIEFVGPYALPVLSTAVSMLPEFTLGNVVTTLQVGAGALIAGAFGCELGRVLVPKIRPLAFDRLMPPPQPFVVNPNDLAQVVAPAENASLGTLPATLPAQLTALRLDATTCRSLTNEEVNRLVTSCPQLSELTLEGECPLVDGHGWKYLANLKELKRLAVTLELSENQTTAPFESLDVTELLPSWSHFEAVDVRLEASKPRRWYCQPTERELSFLSKCPVGPQVRLRLKSRFDMKPIIKACPSMTSLKGKSLTSPITLFSDDARLLAKHCPQLKSLTAQLRRPVNETLAIVAKGCQELSYLEIVDCQDLAQPGIERLVYYCKQLEEICLIGAMQMDDVAVRTLATLPKLRSVELLGSQVVTDEGVNSLLNRENLPALERISLAGSPQISVEMQRRLSSHLLRMQAPRIESDKHKVKEWLELLTSSSGKSKEVQRKQIATLQQMAFLGIEAFVQNHWLAFRAPPPPGALQENNPLMVIRQQLAEALELPEEGTILVDSGVFVLGLLQERVRKSSGTPSLGPTLEAQLLEELKETYLGDGMTPDSIAGLVFRAVGTLSYFASLVDSKPMLSVIQSYLELSESKLSINDLVQVTETCKDRLNEWVDEHKQLLSEGGAERLGKN